MKRFAAILLSAVCMCSLSAALAQTAECPAGGFSVWVPDHFDSVQIDPLFDQDLCFYWHGNKLAVQAYVSAQSGSDLFQVLTGSEEEYGPVTVNGKDMLYSMAKEFGKIRISYSWMDQSRGNSVTLEFTYSADDPSVQSTVDKIINSINFN